jgi:hypothetical protein
VIHSPNDSKNINPTFEPETITEVAAEIALQIRCAATHIRSTAQKISARRPNDKPRPSINPPKKQSLNYDVFRRHIRPTKS